MSSHDAAAASPLRTERLNQRLSLEALAQAAGVSTATVWRAEKGRHATSSDTWAALAAALGVDVADLHGADATPASPGRAEKHDSPDPHPLAGEMAGVEANGG